jgi:hypothetical protein
MVKDHLQKQEGAGIAAEKEGQVVGFIIGEMKGEGFGLEKSGWLEVATKDQKEGMTPFVEKRKPTSVGE